MRKIILMMSVSVDGFFEGPDRELDWHMVDDELHNRAPVRAAVVGKHATDDSRPPALPVTCWPWSSPW
jgi:hypothetical protein